MAENTQDFNQLIIDACSERAKWFDTEVLPSVQENYRNHLSCVQHISQALVKYSLITPDPYKNDSKVTEIVPPETTEFSDSERSIKLGIRLDQYDSMLDYVCNYTRFSVEQLNMDKIKKLVELNSSFSWAALNPNSSKMNTRALAMTLMMLKSGADSITNSVIKESVSKAASTITDINDGLKKLAEFQRENYKAMIRSNILLNPQFSKQTAYQNKDTFCAEVKKMFPSAMGKKPYAQGLVTELAEEELGAKKEALCSSLLAKLKVESKKDEKIDNKIDTHEILMDVVRNLGTLHEQYSLILAKIEHNHEIIQNSKISGMEKIKKFFRKVFNLKDPPIDYTIYVMDKVTNTKKSEKIHYVDFIEALTKRIKSYQSFSVRRSPGYNRIGQQNDTVIFDFLNKQIVENSKLYGQLAGLDECFKNSASVQDRPKIRGISMEMTALKNTLTKVNQYRAEYLAYLEEAEQMKKLGITD